MPNNKTKRQGAIYKATERKSRSHNPPPNEKSELKLLEARREQLRSSSMPAMAENLSKVQETKKSRPHSAENNVNTSGDKVHFKTLLHCMLAGEWMSALGRMTNLEEKSPELRQSNVNISFLIFLFSFSSLKFSDT